MGYDHFVEIQHMPQCKFHYWIEDHPCSESTCAASDSDGNTVHVWDLLDQGSRLLLCVGCDPKVLGIEYCLANPMRVMVSKGGVVGRCM